MPNWFAIYEEANGRLESLGTIKASPLPPGLAFKLFSVKPSDEDMWDEATLSFVPRPPKVLVDRFDNDLLNNPKFKGFREVYDSLPKADQNKIRKVIRTLLGIELKRSQSESDEIGVED